MTNVSRVRALLAACSLTLIGYAAAANDPHSTTTQRVQPVVNAPPVPMVVAQAEAASPPRPTLAVQDAPPAGGSNASGLALPPTPMQTALVVAGALLAIVLAIVGVTVTFRSMRDEMRRGRGRPRRSARSGAATSAQS